MKPTHYADPQGDLIDIIYQACPMAAIFFCAVNSIKYHKRLGKKDGASVLDDLDKAQEYHRRLEAMLDGKPISYYMRLANQAYYQDKADDELDQMCAEMAKMPDAEVDANMAALADTLKGTSGLPESELASDRHSGSAIEQLFGLAKEPDNELPKGVTIDTREVGEYDQTKFRRLCFGEAIPDNRLYFVYGEWKPEDGEHTNSYFLVGNSPSIVPIDHPITPFKNDRTTNS